MNDMAFTYFIVIGLPILSFILIILGFMLIPKKKGESVKEWWRKFNSGDWS